jgi:hypothetical protein
MGLIEFCGAEIIWNGGPKFFVHQRRRIFLVELSRKYSSVEVGNTGLNQLIAQREYSVAR